MDNTVDFVTMSVEGIHISSAQLSKLAK